MATEWDDLSQSSVRGEEIAILSMESAVFERLMGCRRQFLLLATTKQKAHPSTLYALRYQRIAELFNRGHSYRSGSIGQISF